MEKGSEDIYSGGQMIGRYFKVWRKMAGMSSQIFLISRLSTLFFLAGKIFRIVFFLLFLIFLISKTKLLANYNIWQVLLFYMTFNLIDGATQMLFREVYRFRQLVETGNFDLLLVKPVNSLFRVLLGWVDLLDFVTLLPFFIVIIFIFTRIPGISILGIILYFFLLLNALIIAASFHIFILSLALLTTQIDQTLMIYREVTSMGKIPINVYQEPIRSLLTFIIPVGMMMSFPVQAIIRQLKWEYLLFAFITSFALFRISLLSWKNSLRHYTSVSS